MAEPVILTWSDVVAFHAVQAGISTRNGKVCSILCNQSKDGEYADEVRADAIFYRVTPSTNAASVEALKRMVGSGESVRVYEKLGVNRWLDHSSWLVADSAPEGDGLLFLLKKAAIVGSSLPQ
jgi:hypothetical protein